MPHPFDLSCPIDNLGRFLIIIENNDQATTKRRVLTFLCRFSRVRANVASLAFPFRTTIWTES